MRASVRRLAIGAFGAAAILVLMGSFVQAQAQDSMNNATPWFCLSNSNCTYLNRVGQPVTAGALKQAYSTAAYWSNYEDASGGTAGASASSFYALRWTTGDHAVPTDNTCFQTTTSTKFLQTNGSDAIFETSASGTWSKQGPVSMPHAGIYTVCAAPTAANPNASAGQFLYPFIVI